MSPFGPISPRPNILAEQKPIKPTKAFIAVKPTSVNMKIEVGKQEDTIAEVKKPQEAAKPRKIVPKRSTRNDKKIQNDSHMKYISEVLTVSEEVHKASSNIMKELTEELDLDKKPGAPIRDKIIQPITNLTTLEKLSEEIQRAKTNQY